MEQMTSQLKQRLKRRGCTLICLLTQRPNRVNK